VFGGVGSGGYNGDSESDSRVHGAIDKITGLLYRKELQMTRLLKNKARAGVLVLGLVALGIALGGDDVTVQQGTMTVDNDLTVGGDLEVQDGYFETLITSWYLASTGSAVFYTGGYVGDFIVGGTVYCGKIHGGWFDPEWVQYDRQTRAEIVESVKRSVTPEKQGGAVVFFNNDTKRLEIYIPNEGKFYDLQGNVLYTLPKVEVLTTGYQTAYYIDNFTGEVRARQKLAGPTYIIKKGFTLDEKTGQFMNINTGEPASRQEALEIYVRGEGNYYDLKGNLIRSEPKAEEIQYVTRYYFDSRTGEVRGTRKPVHDRYMIRRGFKLDKKTGQFIDEATGQVVPKDRAVRIEKGP